MIGRWFYVLVYLLEENDRKKIRKHDFSERLPIIALVFSEFFKENFNQIKIEVI